MPEAVSILDRWDTFYVIIGSSSAALTGLMFVVITLMPDPGRGRTATHNTVSAFATPTIIHFCAALLVSAVLTAPWSGLWAPGLALGASGVAGLVYSVIVTRRIQRATEYKPVLEDWVWHVSLPLLSYTTLVVGGLLLRNDSAGALYCLGAATLLLLFVGIHNAWDTVTYIKLDLGPPDPKDGPKRA